MYTVETQLPVHMVRVKEELTELTARYRKLKEWTDSPNFKDKVSEDEQWLQLKQLAVMREYIGILEQRLSLYT